MEGGRLDAPPKHAAGLPAESEDIMKKYKYNVGYTTRTIEANTKKEAIEKALKQFPFDHVCTSSFRVVERIEVNKK